MESSEPVRRTSEIEEITNRYFIHPLAGLLALLFAKWRVTPNAVSLIGMLFGLMAGIAYYHYRNPWCTIAGFALMIAWHVMDGADGQLARLTNSQSQFGQTIDSICDHVTFIAVYTALALALSREYGGWVWFVVVLAGLCHALQAPAYEAQRQEYNFWGWDRGIPMSREGSGESTGTTARRRMLDSLYHAYGAVQRLVTETPPAFDEQLTVALQRQPEQATSIRARYREVFSAPVRRWGILSANYRTLGIFVAALLGAPLWYFWFEIVGFSVIWIVLEYRQRVLSRHFRDELAAAV